MSQPTFVDLFAGIGGFRRAFESQSSKCVFACEIDLFARRTYEANYGGAHPMHGDIRTLDAQEIPDHDILLAGFPCPPFSRAGVSKRNSLNRPHGLASQDGTLYLEIARIIDHKRPKVFMLENVKSLLTHNQGSTLQTILDDLASNRSYNIHYRILDSSPYVPQRRERLIIVGFRASTGFCWDDLTPPVEGPRLASVLHKTDGTEPLLPWDGNRYYDHGEGQVRARYTLTPKLWSYLQAYADKHQRAGNGFGYSLVTPQSVARTLSARYYKDGSEILLDQYPSPPRRLTPRECARLMGYPDSHRIPVSDTQAYRQFGNSVVVPMIADVASLVLQNVNLID